jgi:hypothetical protein
MVHYFFIYVFRIYFICQLAIYRHLFHININNKKKRTSKFKMKIKNIHKIFKLKLKYHYRRITKINI